MPYTALGSDGQGPQGLSFVFLDLFDFFDLFTDLARACLGFLEPPSRSYEVVRVPPPGMSLLVVSVIAEVPSYGAGGYKQVICFPKKGVVRVRMDRTIIIESSHSPGPC